LVRATSVSTALACESQPERGLTRLPQQVGCWTSCLLLGVGLWLLARRFDGALVKPLDAEGLIAAAVVLILLSRVARWRPRNTKQALFGLSRAGQVLRTLATVGLIASGVAVSLPGSPLGALALFWCLLLAAEGAQFVVRRLPGGLRKAGPGTAAANQAQDLAGGRGANCAISSPPPFSLAASTIEGDDGELLPQNASQRLSRYQEEAGGEIVSGVVRCSFAANERQRDLHLAFCPPLKRIPQFSAEQVEGPPARIRPSLVEAFGVGLEVKLAALSSEPTSVQIQFFACEEPIVEEAG